MWSVLAQQRVSFMQVQLLRFVQCIGNTHCFVFAWWICGSKTSDNSAVRPIAFRGAFGGCKARHNGMRGVPRGLPQPLTLFHSGKTIESLFITKTSNCQPSWNPLIYLVRNYIELYYQVTYGQYFISHCTETYEPKVISWNVMSGFFVAVAQVCGTNIRLFSPRNLGLSMIQFDDLTFLLNKIHWFP